MKLTYTLKTAYRSLTTHKLRAALTMLGIVMGVAAVMLVFAVGKGAESLILGQVQSLGAKTIAVVPGREPKGPTDPAIIEVFFSDSLKMRELEALKKSSNVPKLAEIMPMVFSVETVSYEGETFRPMVLGASELIARMFDLFPEEGLFFSDADVASRAAVALIGERVKDEFFGSSDAIGEKIRIKDKNFRVIGVLPKKGQLLFFNVDESIIVPYTTAQEYIFGIKHFNRFVIRVELEEDIEGTVVDIEATLRELHGITDPENNDFFVGTQAEITETLKAVTGTLTLFLTSVAAISLLVGGVGIMNVMLVSVAERTKEIGLRKALGATRRNILIQFLVEVAVLTGIGGLVGVFLGAGLSASVSLILTYLMDIAWPFTFPWGAAILGVAVSVFVGLVFGIYPAYVASKKSPVEAMRYE